MRSGTGSVAVIAKRCQKTTGRLGPRQVSPASARAAARAGMRASAASHQRVATSNAARRLLRACRSDESRAQLAVTFAVLFPHLDERQRRLLMAAEVRGLDTAASGAGARVSAASEVTVRTGVVEQAEAVIGRIARASGAPRRE
jgi:hypothetical protein